MVRRGEGLSGASYFRVVLAGGYGLVVADS